MLLIFFTSPFRVFGIKDDILNKLFFNLFLYVFPWKVRQFYLLIHNLDFIIFVHIKGLDRSLWIASKFSKKLRNLEFSLFTVFALVSFCLSERPNLLDLILNELVQFLGDFINAIFFGSRTLNEDCNLRNSCILIHLTKNLDFWVEYVLFSR
jgi:hypothetical protein